MLKIDCKLTEKVLVAFIKDAVRKNGFRNAIVGVSGGLDSAVVLALCRKALGARHTFALLLPYRLSSPASTAHGRELCRQLGVNHERIDISPAVDAYFDRYPAETQLQVGNKCARERMSVLYDFSARKQALVAGTSNKSELLVGYSTQFGDSAAAFLPIGDLYKTQVFELARHLGIPKAILAKTPTADLWPDQTDEGEIGIAYKDLDVILHLMVDRRFDEGDIVERGYPLAAVRRVKEMIVRSQFKRTMPPVAKLHQRTVGIDFRYLRDWNK
ncbi:MAG: NAD+ synthase [Candidatus Aminicenantes bacterium]|nr:NAD+ synthase [Candidatus Aminicenantes bacterium]